MKQLQSFPCLLARNASTGRPYVYIIQNKDRTHWYVGMRSANRCPAIEDTKYWGSSKYLKALIKKTGKENWTKTIIAEFDTPTEAHEYEQHLIKSMWDLPGRVNKGRNGYCDWSDQEVKANHQAATKQAMERVYQDPEYRANHKAGCEIGAKKRAKDPVWQENQKAGIQKKAQDPTYRAKHQASMEAMHQDPTYRAKHQASMEAMHQDPTYRAKITAANKKRAKAFIATNIATGEEFYCESSVCDQVKVLGLKHGSVSSFLRGTYSSPNYKGFTFRYA